MLKDYFILALKNVRKRGIRSWLTMLGVFIGIAAVVSLISLGQGLETAIAGQFGALSTDTLTIQGADTGFSPPGSTSVRKMSADDLEIIKSISGVDLAIPRLLRVARVEYNNNIEFSFIGSIPNEQEQVREIYKAFNIKPEEGKLLNSEDRGKIVLGSHYTEPHFGKKIAVGSIFLIQDKEFEVIGLLEETSTFTINGAIFMAEDDMRVVFKIPDDEIDFIVARVENKDEIEQVAEEITRKIRKDRDQKPGEEDFEVQTPIQSLSTVSTILNVVNLVVTGIAAISLLVGGVGIANTMFTSVLERTREIGVMKAIGAKNKDILSIFIIEAGLLGLIGGIIGALMGLAMALGVASFANSSLGSNIFQVAPNPALLFGSIGFSLFIGILSGIVPAYQASKLNPVEALRK